MSLRKVLLGAAIAFCAAAGITPAASAGPSAFGPLGCSCKPPVSVPGTQAPASEQMDQGIKNGLDYRRGGPPRRADH
jgi:hypothetical protein